MVKAVVLVSGGLDSCVALWEACSDYGASHVSALAVDYGQRHRRELDSASTICEEAGVSLHVSSVAFASTPLTGGGAVPTGRSPEEIACGGTAPTFVPCRNLVFLALGAARAVDTGAREVWVGCNADDAAGYPDCTSAFLTQTERTLTLALGRSIAIVAPHIRRAKSHVIRIGRELGAPLKLSWSCYQGGMEPCGGCDACVLRADAFARERSMPDAVSRVRMPWRT
jgi:7-cyano-7-deazaguanine synthase